MTICFGKGAAERTDRSVESQSTSDPLVESDENSLFGDNIRVLEIHGESDVTERQQVDKMTSSMADPYKESNKCNLL
jgi:hypothetical protein